MILKMHANLLPLMNLLKNYLRATIQYSENETRLSEANKEYPSLELY